MWYTNNISRMFQQSFNKDSSDFYTYDYLRLVEIKSFFIIKEVCKMQKVIWYGAGKGSMDEPFVLTNTSSFTDEQPFSILVQHGDTIDTPRNIWIKFTNYQTSKVFKLALLYADMSPLAPFKEQDAGKYTCFNGNNNLGVLDGPYMLIEYGSKDYITKQQMFSRSDLTMMYVNEELEHKFVRDVESTDAIESHLSEDPDGRVLRVDLKIGGRNSAIELDGDGIVVSEGTLDGINGNLISTPGNITRNNIIDLLNSELPAYDPVVDALTWDEDYEG